MNANPNDYKETIREEWIGAAPYWKKWNHKLEIQSQAATDLVVQGAQLAPGLHVLDLASGTGQPALTIAKSVAPGGRVIASDLTPAMLEAVTENARARSLSNLEVRLADAERLPFSDAEFDRVTCRFGIMFFPQIQVALTEIRRVLNPTGRFSFLTWGGLQENPLFGATMGPFFKRVQIPPPPPDAPTIFRFTDPDKLTQTLTAAGFREVVTIKKQIPWPWPGSPEDAWEGIRELAAPFRKVIAAVPPEQRDEVMQEVMDNIRRFYDGRQVNFSATVLLATGAA